MDEYSWVTAKKVSLNDIERFAAGFGYDTEMGSYDDGAPWLVVRASPIPDERWLIWNIEFELWDSDHLDLIREKGLQSGFCALYRHQTLPKLIEFARKIVELYGGIVVDNNDDLMLDIAPASGIT